MRLYAALIDVTKEDGSKEGDWLILEAKSSGHASDKAQEAMNNQPPEANMVFSGIVEELHHGFRIGAYGRDSYTNEDRGIFEDDYDEPICFAPRYGTGE